MGAIEVLQGVQFLMSQWESNQISAEMALALIEVHLERESSLKIVKKESQDPIPAEA